MNVICPIPYGCECSHYCDFTGLCMLKNPAQDCEEYRIYTEEKEKEEDNNV